MRTFLPASCRLTGRPIRRRGEWAYRSTDELAGKNVLIVGAGDIGEAVAARLTPFDVGLVRVARQARDGVHSVAELPDLLPEADIVVLHPFRSPRPPRDWSTPAF